MTDAPVILSLGSVNADFEVRVEHPIGPTGTVLARDMLRTSGGKAANVAVVGRRLGAGTRLLGCVGDDDLADQALAGPASAGVDLSAVRRAPGPTGVAWIAVTPDGGKAISLALNANDAWPDDVDAVERDVAAAPAGSVLVVDLEVPADRVMAAVRAARRAGLTVVLDPAPPERLPEGLLPLVEHVTPDHEEAGALTGVDASSRSGAHRAGEALCAAGVGTAHVKLPRGGCVTVASHRTSHVDVPEDLHVVDATGAGDGFAGVLAWALLDGQDPQEAGALAVAGSACAVGTYGSQESYPTRAGLEAMRARLSRTQG